jgi:hypothetical protein
MSAQRGKCVGVLVICGEPVDAVGLVVDFDRVVSEAPGNPNVGGKLCTRAFTPSRCDV